MASSEEIGQNGGMAVQTAKMRGNDVIHIGNKMLGGGQDKSCMRKAAVIVAGLCLFASVAIAQDVSLAARIDEIRETGRYIPPKAMAALARIDAEARAASPDVKADYLEVLSNAQRGTGDNKSARIVSDELLALGQANKNNVIIAKGLLAKAYTAFAYIFHHAANTQIYAPAQHATLTVYIAPQAR
eukprot:gene27078-48585_t